MYDVTILTASKYLNPKTANWYVRQILDEDNLVKQALEKRGLKTLRTSWDRQDFDWTKTRYILFRTIWDYFDRFDEFVPWLDMVNSLTKLINPYDTIRWNFDKHYLRDLEDKGVNIPPTLFIEPGEKHTLQTIVNQSGWKESVLKPAVSGAGRHTYRLRPGNIAKHESLFSQLIKSETMLLQEFQEKVISKGEVALMLFGGQYSHAVLKKAKAGDFRVQDDFGGSVHDYQPSDEEIKFAEKVVSLCDPIPVYARVDIIRDNNNDLCISELELIEPELWFRSRPSAAGLLAVRIADMMEK